MEKISGYDRVDVLNALEAFGERQIRKGLPALDHVPSSSWCDCFVGTMVGKAHAKYSCFIDGLTCPNTVAASKLTDDPRFRHHVSVLSYWYEKRTYEFKTVVMDWLAQQEAIRAVTTPNTKQEEPALV